MNGKIYVYFNRKKFEQEGIKKYYVGQTNRTLTSRAGGNGQGYHKYDLNNKTKFANAIRKWGWDAFEGEIIIEGVTNQEELNELEKHYIQAYDSFENGYNSTLGGDGVTGCKHTGMYGKEFTEEHRRKLSESHIGIQAGEKHPMYGKKHSEETRQKIKQGMQGKIQYGVNRFENVSDARKYEIFIKQSTPVTCKELNITFLFISEATRYLKSVYGINCPHSNIVRVCKGRRKSCVSIVLNGETIKLTWKYAKDTNND